MAGTPVRMVLGAALLVAGCGLQEPYVAPSLPAATVPELPDGEIATTVFLIGDAGDPRTSGREPTFVALERQASHEPDRSVVLFLGDNIYPSGLPPPGDPGRMAAEHALMAQLRVVLESGARGLFLTGNHDWDWGGSQGWAAIARQERFLEDSSGTLARLAPRGGCPGPDVVDVGERLRLILLDTPWWLHPHERPSGQEAGCDVTATERDVLTALAGALETAGERTIIVAGHHPLESYGTHGGFFPWQDHIFPLRHLASWLWVPLPLIGSAYPASRMLGISDQDLSSARYRRMAGALDSVLAIRPPLLYAAGHEHTLQVLRTERPFMLLVSGSGTESHDDPLTSAPSMLFGDTGPGFMRIDLALDGRARLAVVQPADDRGTPRETFSVWLRGPAAQAGKNL